ncbi:MAG: ATPase, T2SS/T4P/T4SS family [Candidatus Burarchaeum sp.]|nr:ATPase, T2SS/T4P/T4SS family [Candidatus Burarchaeum sp.]MDO8339737.1 ATPase, T2SS/T4P/T4SS family [Candidatus Burarchaeum sp.]
MKVLDSYKLMSDNVPAEVQIVEREEEFVNTYELTRMHFQLATQTVMDHLKEKVIEEVNIRPTEAQDAETMHKLREAFVEKASDIVRRELVGTKEDMRKVIVGTLAHELIGLGEMELLLSDDNLEEIVVNTSKEPLWVYHKKWGWLKTNFTIPREEQIHNYAAIIGRQVGRQITNLNPLLDAHLEGGDRANATLFPISTKGNSITIRKFAKSPWTITRMLDPKNTVMSIDVAALLWLSIQYEMNIIVAGGTASGKTSVLNALLVFTPPNQRVISIEDTRELYLPEFLHWLPMVTRLPNPEGKGEVSMLDLMVNSLRMRPDRIVLGEIRRQREAEVLFEAMHTGHSVLATLHADSAEQAKNRMVQPPISLPESMLEAVHLILVQYRQRRTGIRRTLELAEVVPYKSLVTVNKVYQWNARSDQIEKVGDYARVVDEIMMYSGMNQKEIESDLAERKMVLQYMLDNKLYDINDVGRISATFYRNKEFLLEKVKKKANPSEIFSGLSDMGGQAEKEGTKEKAKRH